MSCTWGGQPLKPAQAPELGHLPFTLNSDPELCPGSYSRVPLVRQPPGFQSLEYST